MQRPTVQHFRKRDVQDAFLMMALKFSDLAHISVFFKKRNWFFSNENADGLREKKVRPISDIGKEKKTRWASERWICWLVVRIFPRIPPPKVGLSDRQLRTMTQKTGSDHRKREKSDAKLRIPICIPVWREKEKNWWRISSQESRWSRGKKEFYLFINFNFFNAFECNNCKKWIAIF